MGMRVDHAVLTSEIAATALSGEEAMRIGYWPRALIGAALGVALTGVALAQTPARVRGQIATVEGNTLTVKARDGALLTIKVPDNLRVMAYEKASFADIKPNSYIGVAADPQADGTQRAYSVHIFLESQRGTGEGSRPHDLRSGSMMTNAAVETTVASVDGQVVTVKYKVGERTGEQKIVVPPDTPVVAYATGSRSELKPGAQIFIPNAQKQPDGTITTQSINVGRGLTPAM